MLKGYLRDRESSEFTIYHLKECIRMLAACPEIETINLISHSRGTDVLVTAIRELILVGAARGEDTRETLKLGRIVFAAPDMDNEVVTQRVSAEDIFFGADSWTVYINENDRALGASELLFSNPQRLGKVRVSHYQDPEIQRAHARRNVWLIDSRVKTDFTGHGYFLSSPATSSDLILSLRYERPVGVEHGRPLTRLIPTYYILDDNYPRQAAPLPKGSEDR
jgi:esterase/lipase superfamily enzyme